jgi:epoxyqueuosine reductase
LSDQANLPLGSNGLTQMTPDEGNKAVKQAAANAGFDRCGIASAGPIQHADFYIDWLNNGYAGGMAYLSRRREARLDVRDWLPWARSVIVVAMNYYRTSGRGEHPGSATRDDRHGFGDGRGRVALYASGADYHTVAQEKLQDLATRMREAFDPPFQARICVDTSPIVERELAAAAGIGWIGKNTLVLHQSLGSFFFLGEIITDLDLAPDAAVPDRCGTCRRCLEACPTGALLRPCVMDARKCISYLTIEHRGEIDPLLADQMGDWVFGCDLCQEVCPFNRRAPETAEPRLYGSLDDCRLSIEAILGWDEDMYKARVQGKAWARAKLCMWKRNAAIVKRNMGDQGREALAD